MMKFFKFISPWRDKKIRAFTLVETLVAISIFSISVVAVMSVLASGISYTNYAKKKMIASFLAQEGIEYMRNMRDTYILYTETTGNNWDKFKIQFNSCNDPSLGNACGFTKPLPFDVSTCPSLKGCILYIDDGSYRSYPNSSTVSIDSGFVREIWMTVIPTIPAGYQVKIFSKVEWTQGSGAKSVTFSENLFNLE